MSIRFQSSVLMAAGVVIACLAGSAPTRAAEDRAEAVDALSEVAPALARYRDDVLESDLWAREGLSPRDRSIVTLSALIARSQTARLAPEIERALDNGVAPGEVSEIVTHLAFYAGWSNAMAAVPAVQAVFRAREVESEQLPAARPDLLPLDEEAEKAREERVEAMYGDTAPGVLEYTTEVLFRDLWLRPALAPRDRSLVTFSALVASGQSDQVGFHLGKAMDNGLTQTEASEALTQLAFYAGWPKVFSALPTVKDVFAQRSE